MNISDDGQTAPLAEFPEVRVVPAIKADDPGIQAMWIQIVIRNELYNAADIVLPPAKKKGATDAQIAGVREFERGSYDAKEKLGFRLADRLHRGARDVDDAFYAELKGAFSDTEIVELFLTAAAFEMFPRFIDGLHIPVTPLPAAK